MKHHHCVVWIDHREAHVLSHGMAPESEDVERRVIRAHHMPQKLHHRSDGTSSGHALEDSRYYLDVVEALKSAGEILLTGPSNAKDHLKHVLASDFPQIAAKVVGVETVDHPSEAELIAFARKTFTRLDRMRPQL